MKKKIIKVSDSFQDDYSYTLTEKEGQNFATDFKPDLTPKQMLELGIFGGIYFSNGGDKEFPKAWFKDAKISQDGKHNKDLNFFKIKASQPLKIWQQKGWIYKDDPRGWVQWYFRYYLGRRIPEEDRRQIDRWKAIKRHVSQVAQNCRAGDLHCRPRQRQALLHWAYDSRKI